MNFLDKLDYLMARDGLNRHTLSVRSGIPYSTIDSLYKKGYERVKLATLRKLAACFGVTLDYLALDGAPDPSGGPGTDRDGELSRLLRALDAHGREIAEFVICREYERCSGRGGA